MITIDINKEIGCKKIKFPDGQPHLQITENFLYGQEVSVRCSILDSDHLLMIAQAASAIDGLFAKKSELVIPYLMGARFDRRMQVGDGLDLKVFASIINSCGFDRVYVLDPHSDVSCALIEKCIPVGNDFLLNEYKHDGSVLICPDAGASKKVGQYIESCDSIKDVVYCIKNRDLSNGSISLKVINPEKCFAKPCVIVDDLIDGGGTFLSIASQINPSRLTLIVTHGVFSRGVDVLENIFDEVIVSDSYQEIKHPIVKQIKSPI